MKSVLTFSFLIVLTSNAFGQLPGNYSKKGNDFTYSLSLASDSTFSFSTLYFEANASCEGKWLKLSADTLLLTYTESTLAEKLQGGYMSQREIRVAVLKRGRLKIGKVIMNKEQAGRLRKGVPGSLGDHL